MSREVLVLARTDSADRGRIISENKNWGKEELNTDKFVVITIDDDDTDLYESFETGKQSLGPLDEKGVPTVIKETKQKYSFSNEKVDEVLAAGGKKSLAMSELTIKG